MSRVNATATNRTIADLYGDITSKSLVLQPEFQRRFVWNLNHQKMFIDTILKGLPFPEVYIADSGIDVQKISTQKVVVDGQQRLSTILRYIDGDITVKSSDTIVSYADLSDKQKKEFLNYPVVVRQLGDVNEATIKEVFRRINLTRYALNAYEIHHAIYSGEFISLSQHVANLDSFKNLPTFSESDSLRMQDVGFALLVLSTFENGGYFSGDREIDAYVKKYDDNYPRDTEVKRKVESVLAQIYKMKLGDDSTWFRKSNLFTLITELLFTKNIPKDLKARLIDFELQINRNKDSDKENDYSRYYSYMYTGTNSRKARVERSQIFRSKVLDS